MKKNKLRNPISKKIRFEVFKRDGFTCQYCGSMPPKVTLEVDHIKPVASGGNNDIENLVTSCFDCNRGKGKHELSKIPGTIAEKMEVIKEQELQYSEYQKLLRKIERRKNKEIESVNKIYESYFEGWQLKETFKKNTVKMFIQKIGLMEVRDSMEIACSKIGDSEKAIKYFCGICWNKAKGKERPWEN